MPSEEDLQATAAAAQQREQSKPKRNMLPKLCSNCLMGAEDKKGFFLEDQSDGVQMMLCSLRCMAIWATTRGWKRA